MFVRTSIGSITQTTKGSKMRIGRSFIEKKFIRDFVIYKKEREAY